MKAIMQLEKMTGAEFRQRNLLNNIASTAEFNTLVSLGPDEIGPTEKRRLMLAMKNAGLQTDDIKTNDDLYRIAMTITKKAVQLAG